MTNRILRKLSPEARDFLDGHALTRPVSPGELIYPDRGTLHPLPCSREAAVISLMGHRENGTRAEKAAIGNEGFLGLAVILGGRFRPEQLCGARRW